MLDHWSPSFLYCEDCCRPTTPVLDEAKSVRLSREENYAPPADNFRRIAQVWSGIFDHEVTAEQVALCMIGLKLSRESFKHGRDNLVDMAGYVDCLAEITKEN